MEKQSLREAPKVPFDLDGHILCNHKNIDIVHLNLKPGEKIDKHINHIDVVFIVLEGKALLTTGESETLIIKDDCITIESGLTRGMENTSNEAFKVLVIKFKE